MLTEEMVFVPTVCKFLRELKHSLQFIALHNWGLN